jgi:hypothetical protein
MTLGARARLKWLWLRRSWTFRWAHKPLCARYRSHVLRLGALRLCRSCACVYAGIAAGILLLAAVELPRRGGPTAYALVLATVLGLSLPRNYYALPRGLRDVVRWLTGALLPVTAYFLLGADVPLGLLGTLLFAAAYFFYARLRAAHKARACDHCSELRRGGVCSGYALQADAARRFEREASTYVMEEGNGLPERSTRR